MKMNRCRNCICVYMWQMKINATTLMRHRTLDGKDIVGGIGSVGKVCFYEQNNYYNEEPTGIIYEKDYSAIRNQRQVEIGLTLLKEHFGRFLYHTLMLLPQAFISTRIFSG